MGIPPSANDDFTAAELDFVRGVREAMKRTPRPEGIIGGSFGDALSDADIIAEYRGTKGTS